MNDMVDRVTASIMAVPELRGRTNKSRADGKIYEIIYLSEEDGEPVVAGAFDDYCRSCEAVDGIKCEMQARAAIKAMREPTEAMVADALK